jgi:hypothetical protein
VIARAASRRRSRVEEDDDRAGGFLHDLVDQAERVVGAFPESDARGVGSPSGGDGADVFDVDLARDHLVAEGRDDRRDQGEPVLALVGDQDSRMLGLRVAHPPAPTTESDPPEAHGRELRLRGRALLASSCFASKSRRGGLFRLQLSAGVARRPQSVSAEPKRQESGMTISGPNRATNGSGASLPWPFLVGRRWTSFATRSVC